MHGPLIFPEYRPSVLLTGTDFVAAVLEILDLAAEDAVAPSDAAAAAAAAVAAPGCFGAVDVLVFAAAAAVAVVRPRLL